MLFEFLIFCDLLNSLSRAQTKTSSTAPEITDSSTGIINTWFDSMTRLFLVIILKLLPFCLVCSPSAEQIECTISEKQNSELSSNVLLD